jgi:hypothetical protein
MDATTLIGGLAATVVILLIARRLELRRQRALVNGTRWGGQGDGPTRTRA